MNTAAKNQREEFETTDHTQFGQESSEQSSTAVFGNGQKNQSDAQSFSSEDHVELKYRSVKNVSTAKLAKGIGVFSIALGLAEVLAPAQVGELIGVSNRYRKFLPILGLREIAHGIGILYHAKPTGAVWTRIAGDAVDLAFLGAAFTADENNKRRLTGATIAVLGVAALDLLCAQQLSSQNWRDEGNPMAPTTVGQTSGRRAVSS
jgi:hypothetical protein